MVATTTATATPSPLDPALKNLPRGNVRTAADAFPADEFTTIANVPVFAEHQTKVKDGRHLRFGRDELSAVADRCNRRITENGDYAAISLGHTPDPGNPNQQMPEVVGFAGPFRLGTIGEEGQRQRYAILADFHVFKEDLDKVRKHPRRSPEVWLEEDYAEMFLDPISLLSSTCPRLDLGLLYSASRHGRIVEKYTAVAPAAGNVFVPTDDYSAGSSGFTPTPNTGGIGAMLASEDIRQIIDALDQTDVFQWAKSQMQQDAGVNASVPPGSEMPPVVPPAEAPTAPPPVDVSPPVPPAEPSPPAAGPAALGDAGPPAPTPPAAAGPPGAEPPMAPDADEDPEKMACRQYSADGGKANATGEYQTADQKEDMAGGKIDHTLGTDRKNYAALDEMEDNDFEEYARHRRRRSFQGKKKTYQADGSADGEKVETPGDASVEPNDPGPKGEASVDDVDGESTGEYQTAKPPAKFSRQEAEESRELLKLRQDVQTLRQQIDTERASRVDAERYSALSERRQFYAFELDDEVERCRCSKMSAQQFDEHVVGIEQNYRPLPFGGLPTHGNGVAPKTVTSPEVVASGIVREKYDRAHSAKAREICERRVAAGEQPDYEDVLEQVKAGTVPVA